MVFQQNLNKYVGNFLGRLSEDSSFETEKCERFELEGGGAGDFFNSSRIFRGKSSSSQNKYFFFAGKKLYFSFGCFLEVRLSFILVG